MTWTVPKAMVITVVNMARNAKRRMFANCFVVGVEVHGERVRDAQKLTPHFGSNPQQLDVLHVLHDLLDVSLLALAGLHEPVIPHRHLSGFLLVVHDDDGSESAMTMVI